VVGFVAAVAGVVGLFYLHALFAAGPVGVAVQVCAALLMLWSRVTLGRRSFHAAADPTAGGLVTSGPYRWLRHPIYAAILYFVWAGAASHPRSPVISLALLITAGLALRMRAEESLLSDEFSEYGDYAARTRRVVPLVI